MAIFDFNTIAEKYDHFYDTPIGQKIDHVEKQVIWSCLLQSDLEKPFLEIGCGTGHWTRFLRQKGLEITAVDIAERMLAIARGKNPESVDFRLMRSEELAFQDHSFFNIISIATLEFVDNLKKTMEETNRVLSPEGTLIVGCLNELSEIGQHKEENEVYKDARFFTPESLADTLSGIGKPEIDGCAIIQGEKVLDYPDYQQVTKEERLNKGAFLAGIVKKNVSL